jgi:hypothetical protein
MKLKIHKIIYYSFTEYRISTSLIKGFTKSKETKDWLNYITVYNRRENET